MFVDKLPTNIRVSSVILVHSIEIGQAVYNSSVTVDQNI